MAARCTGAADDEAGDRTSKMADRRLATSAILFFRKFWPARPRLCNDLPPKIANSPPPPPRSTMATGGPALPPRPLRDDCRLIAY
jgi:hypothetical protein